MESSILCSLSGISLHWREYAKRLVLLGVAKFSPTFRESQANNTLSPLIDHEEVMCYNER